MSTQLALSAAALVQPGDAPERIGELIANAIAACATARAAGLALHEPAVRALRAIREAGRLLSLVQRSDGGRPLKNSSRTLTGYQHALKEAGISRQTASRWRRVAEVPEIDFERFIVEAHRAGHDVTVAELLRACSPPRRTLPGGRTVKLLLSEDEFRAFQRQVGVLGAVYFTATVTRTVIAVLSHAYSGWLAAQTGRRRANTKPSTFVCKDLSVARHTTALRSLARKRLLSGAQLITPKRYLR
jgi:hypothetical protein